MTQAHMMTFSALTLPLLPGALPLLSADFAGRALDERTVLTDVNRPEARVTNLHRSAGDVDAESPPPFVPSDDHNDLPAHT
jgi:hypothetical protein